jgi:hypothetical protein
MTEEELEGIWIVDPAKDTRLAAVLRHFEKHGEEVDAETPEQYLRKAQMFNQQARKRRGQGRAVEGPTPGVREFKKSGRYIHVSPNGEIVSFGKDHAAAIEDEDDSQF